MTFDEAIRNNQAFAEEWQAQLSSLIVEMGTMGLSLIKNRILTTGMNADDQMFDPYSTTPMLANCSSMTQAACSKTAGSKKKRREHKWVTLQRLNSKGKRIRVFELAGGYKEFRELHGRQTGFVDFAFSGRMWADVQIINSEVNGMEAKAVIGTLTGEQDKILAGNMLKRGDILELSQAEIAELQGVVEQRINNLLAKHNLL